MFKDFLEINLFFIEEYPTEESLKKEYRKLVKKYHPDVGGNAKEFRRLQEEYKNLLSSGCYRDSIRETVEGIDLSELGKGLGPTTNGIICKHCEGLGYESYHDGHGYKVCNVCDELGQVPSIYKCRPCNGKGKFTQRSGRIVDCYKCNGTGAFKHPHQKTYCLACGGSKTIRINTKSYYVKCAYCHGCGEIEIMNPVLPKGLIAINE